MENYISIKLVADNISDNPLLLDIPFERIVNYAITLMRIVGCPKIFVDKVCTLEIKEWRATLPCDFLNIIQVKNENGICYRYTTDSFHMELKDSSILTYKILGNYIYTSNEVGTITVAYQALAIDEEGYPMIPDNSSFIEALECYIKKKHYNNLFDQGKLPAPVYQEACQLYAWYVGLALSDLVRPSIDLMESITNIINTLIPRVTDHRNGFINSGNKEYLRRQ